MLNLHTRYKISAAISSEHGLVPARAVRPSPSSRCTATNRRNAFPKKEKSRLENGSGEAFNRDRSVSVNPYNSAKAADLLDFVIEPGVNPLKTRHKKS